MSHSRYRLPAEWERQSATLLAWPSAESDWRDQLEAIRDEYRELITVLMRFQTVVLLTRPGEEQPSGLPLDHPRLHCLSVDFDDTWCRDYGPIVLVSGGQRMALDFHFNGWGGKYPAALDNRVNSHLARHELFNRLEFRQYLLEFEGGAIDCDGQGRVLINRHCLRTRHSHMSDAEIDHQLQAVLNLDEVIGIDLEPMPGDDTDGHIDTLVRFVDTDTLVFQVQADTARTERLRGQLETLRTGDASAYQLHALPHPDDLDPGLPASYANFVLANDACLVPAYGSRHDEAARDILAERFPERETISVPARIMITQSGGPHCASMHIPAALA
ncbi:agmatine deiminase family protein [Wenzhouxiangella sp. XN201]|uniref:agmatine deiminase family protein n=1 Tax=Wenzhouxiangella sp. XN201 TaxID=2710755 RepID=UPI0013CAF099|nr:agmatine deiminase family protein [Wenzhouxiangella sp. XN201]